MEELISDHEKNFIIGGAQKGVRNDGRGLKDYRPMTVETGILFGSNGSARVQLGATDVIVSVKAEMTTVERGDPIVNRLKFFVDISANASPKFAGKGGNELAEEIARALYTAYDSDLAIPNLGKLVLAPTHFWTIFVDATILQYEGNAVDAISLGVKAALFDTEICNVIVRPADEGKVLIDLPDEVSSWRLDISRAPLLISANQIGGNCVFDADLMEELCSSSTLWVGVQPPTTRVDDSGLNEDLDEQLITCIKKIRGGSLEIEAMNAMLANSLAVGAELNGALMRNLKNQQMEDGNKQISQFSKAFLSY